MQFKVHNIRFAGLSPPELFPRVKNILEGKQFIITSMGTAHSDFSKLEIPVIVKLFIVYEITHQLIFKFPKHERYSLGEKIEKSILESIEILILANQASKYEKEKILQRANAKVELLKILFRISLNCRIIDNREYLNMEQKLQEIGKMTQGWIKYSRNAT